MMRNLGFKGFTLIEVLIAIGLLSLMSIAIFQITARSFDINFKLSSESTDYVSIILSLQTIETDLAQIYNPAFSGGTPKDQQQTTDFWSAPLREDGLRRSRVKGNREKITFINNGNRVVEEDSTQSDLQKVTWEIERNNSGAYTLYRSADWDAFHYEDGTAKKPNRVALLENMVSAKFSYYRKENKTWEDQWDSESPYIHPNSRFPDLVALKIELPDPANTANQQTWEVIVKPNVALNPQTPTANVKTTGPTTGGGN